MKWVERIGTALFVIGVICFLFGAGRWACETDTHTTNVICLCGIVSTVIGCLMTNFDSDWLFRD